MPLVARGDGSAQVACDHGIPSPVPPTLGCQTPSTQTSDICSEDVFAETIGIVRHGDNMISHAMPVCAPHAPPLDTHSPSVWANGRLIGRVTDTYAGPGTHVIVGVAQGSVFSDGN